MNVIKNARQLAFLRQRRQSTGNCGQKSFCLQNNRRMSSSSGETSEPPLSSSSSSSTGKPKKTLTLANMNPHLKRMEYAVRGPLVTRANEIAFEIAQGDKCNRPYTNVTKANIGDCHATGQKPITFIRQVLACVTYPALLDNADIPIDVKDRACEILKGCRGCSVGSYTDSPGIDIVRKHVADFIANRDGYPCDWQNIILSSGASDAIKNILKLLVYVDETDNKLPGVMIPIPQYPLYSATLCEFNMQQINYYLDERNDWALDIFELKSAIYGARKCCNPRAIVVINPGNPTGQVLTKENIREIIQFAYCENLMILADEVYQHNVYDECAQFHSFKKVMMEMGEPYSNVELASFMSCSKGFMGECGLRGGYVEIVNMCPDVQKMLMKAISASLCPSVIGQATIDCVVKPPAPEDPSYALFLKEKTQVLQSLKTRAKWIEEAFNKMPGVSCNRVAGAMYAFPSLKLPPHAIEEARNRDLQPDEMYAFDLLECTGICIVPGSGFGQRPNTYHFRTTILPQMDELQNMLVVMKQFHSDFMKEHGYEEQS